MNQRITGKYVYRDESGNVAYWKERLEPGRKSSKEFRFYHGDKESGRGADSILYNLPEVIAGKAVIFTEGEKQADILTRWGLVGTTFDSGANSKFPPAMVEHLRGKRVAILRDNDEPGMVYAEMIGRTVYGVAEVVKIVLLSNLPHKGDLCDWQGTKTKLLEEIKAAPEFIHTPPPAKPKKERRQVETQGKIDSEMVAVAKAVPVDTLLEFHQGYALCLWHEEEKPSLHHHAASNRVKCFSCGFGGSAVDIIMKKEGLDFPSAVKFLAT